MKIFFRGLGLLIFLLIDGALIGQTLQAKFSVNNSTGCSPLNVQFTDQSTGNITSWRWTFGNGNSSNLKNPQAYYTTPGTYTVTLTVSDGTKTSSTSSTITVYQNPSAVIGSVGSHTGCRPLTVNFRDSSLSPGGAISQWRWDFGDGTSSTSQHPSHTYSNPGTYTVTLQVTDIHGCSNTKYITGYVKVSNRPVINYTANNTYSCTPPLNVQFTNSSTGTSPLSYLWKFGDGSTSNQAAPLHTYSSMGNYITKLIVTDSYGCKDSLTRNNYINISNVVASFTTSRDTACIGQSITFTNTSLGGKIYTYSFGDGTSANTANAVHSYSNSGTYTVKFVSVESSTCKDSTTKQIVVESTTANFTADTTFACNPPFTVRFTGQSNNANSWLWNFGDGATSTIQNPTHTYNSVGRFTVTLTTSTRHSCSATNSIGDYIIISPPQPSFDFTPREGCIDLTVKFTNASNSEDPIIGYKWNFGDGNSSTLENPTNIYNTDGVFNVVFMITTQRGCIAYDSSVVRTGTHSTVDFSVIDTTCAFNPAHFYNYSQDSSKIDYYFWQFGEGGTSTLREPEYQYTDTGYMNVTLTVAYHGCRDSLKKDSIIYIKGPISQADFSFLCSSPFDYEFISDVKAGTAVYWDFNNDMVYDDSILFTTETSRIDRVPYTFTTTGNYVVKLHTVNDSTKCIFDATVTAIVRDLHAIFRISDTIPCTHHLDTLDASASQDAVSYSWSSTGPSGSFTHRGDNMIVTGYFYPRGIHAVSLIASAENGCTDTVTHYLKAFQPLSNFVADPLYGCIPLSVNFTDSTKDDTTIIAWNWNFGDGHTSTLQNPVNIYNLIQQNTVRLITRDTLGCIDTLLRSLYILSSKPVPRFSASDSTLCAGDSTHFINATTGIFPVYSWQISNGDTSSQTSPWIHFLDSGYYNVTLLATDTIGCDSAITVNRLIHVQAIPIANFSVDTNIAWCYPHTFYFRDSSVTRYANSWRWTFGDGGTSTLRYPSHTYNVPDFYPISLIVSTTYGCKDTITVDSFIEVKGPYSQFHLVKDTICLRSCATFVIDSTRNVVRYEWDFGDGNVIPGNFKDSIKHCYTFAAGNLQPLLVAHSDTFNYCTKVFTRPIYIVELTADFEADNPKDTIPLDVNFTDLTAGAPNQWIWDFRNGNFSLLRNPPTQTYTDTGTYMVMLIVKDAKGCSDTAIKPIIALPHPYTIDVPTAFTPNGDGENDKIYVRGWSIHKLLEFRIYNRWGQVVFETTDINEGWDGTYNGVKQNMDTYVYTVKAETYSGVIETKKGYITLLR